MSHPSADDDVGDEERPLLGRGNGADQDHTLYDRALAVTREPLTDLSRVLLAACIFLLLLAATFIGLFAGAEHKLHATPPQRDPTTSTLTETQTQTATVTTTVHSQPTPTACYTPECIQLSADILSSLDTSKDPCEDFYDFASGGWRRLHPIPLGRSSWGTFEELGKDNKAVIRNIFESSDDTLSPSDKESLNKIKTLFSSCIDEDTITEQGTEPLLRIIRPMRDILNGKDIGAMNIFGSAAQMPYSSEKAGKHPVTAALAFVHSRGVSALFDFLIEGDAGSDPDNMVPALFQPGLGLSGKEYYTGDELKDVYIDVLYRLLLALDDIPESSAIHDQTTTQKSHFWPPWPWPPWGDDDTPENRTARAHRLAANVYQFESDLAAASADAVIMQDPLATYNPVPLATLAAAVPQINFPAYFAAFAVRHFPEHPVILSYPPFVAAIGDLLRNTSIETLDSYLTVRLALQYAPLLGHDTEAWQATRLLEETISGVKKGALPERGEWCSEQVEQYLGFSVGRFFVRENFGGDSRDKVVKIITDIISAFKTSLKRIDWMDNESSSAAAEKADALFVKVGYPLYPDTSSDKAVASYYAALRLDNATFFENAVQAAILNEKVRWAQLGQRRDHRRWGIFATTVSAYYDPPANEIVFPAGLMRPPFFSAKWPGYLNYGAFGAAGAHELTHAFDSSGRLYNQHGKLEEWWTNTTSDAFDKRAACLSNQYSQYTIDDGKGNKYHVNGNFTSAENIGDSGLIQAFRAWQAQYEESFARRGEYALPGLNYTKEQLFFMSFARMWAISVQPATQLLLLRTNSHSPHKYRVEGTLYNVPEFAKAFNCKPGSKLAPPPEKQCRFW